MNIGISAVAAIGLLASSASALAGEVQRFNGKDGVNVTYRAASGRYCISTHSLPAADRLNLQLHATQCDTQEGWARKGLTVERRAAGTRQIASVD